MNNFFKNRIIGIAFILCFVIGFSSFISNDVAFYRSPPLGTFYDTIILQKDLKEPLLGIYETKLARVYFNKTELDSLIKAVISIAEDTLKQTDKAFLEVERFRKEFVLAQRKDTFFVNEMSFDKNSRYFSIPRQFIAWTILSTGNCKVFDKRKKIFVNEIIEKFVRKKNYHKNYLEYQLRKKVPFVHFEFGKRKARF